MTTAKILASYDSQGADSDQTSTSGLEATAEGAEYHDPITGQVLNATDGGALLQMVQQQLGGFVNKQDLKDQIAAGKLAGDIRKTDGDEWDCVVFDLSAYQDPAKARQIIIETLANPNYQTRKNQGGNRFQDIEVKGKRGVIAWGTHTNQQGIGPHFHAFVHYHAIDGNKLCPRSKLGETHIQPAEEKAINDALAANGLAPLKLLTQGQSGSTPQAKAANAAVANAVATGAPLPPPMAGVAPTLSQVKLSFGELAASKQAEAAKLYQQAQELAKESAIYEQAQHATQQYEHVAAEKDQLLAAFEQLQENHETLAKKHHETHNERNELALALVNTVGLEEDKADLPPAELAELAGKAFDSEIGKAKAETQQWKQEAQDGIEAFTALETQHKDMQAELAKEAELSEETAQSEPAAFTKALRLAWSGLKKEKTEQAKEAGKERAAKMQLQDDLNSLKGLGVESPEALAKLLKESGIKKVGEVKDLKGLADNLKDEASTYRKAAEAEKKAREAAEKQAAKQAEELAELRRKIETEQQAKAEAMKAAKDAQANTEKLAKALEKEKAETAKLSSDNTTAKALLKAAQATNKQLTTLLAKAAPAKKPAGPK